MSDNIELIEEIFHRVLWSDAVVGVVELVRFGFFGDETFSTKNRPAVVAFYSVNEVSRGFSADRKLCV